MNTQRKSADARVAIPLGHSYGDGAELAERRLDHHIARLSVHWKACPECGARELRRPRPDDLAHVAEADGVCEACGAMFACDADGSPRLLSPGSSPGGLPS
jgi:hypothetical protein